MTARISKEVFIQKSNIIHNSQFDYSNVIYFNARTKVKIVCLIHGLFLQTPNNHLYNKRGCKECSMLRLSKQHFSNKEEFIVKARNIHKTKYDYSKVNYISATNKIEIICLKHGSFFQIPSGHLSGKGCKNCWYEKKKHFNIISNKETKWLDSLNLERQKIINVNNTIICVDGYSKDTSTIYEFYGDFWHGNPKKYNPKHINCFNKKSFSYLYEKTLFKEELLKNAGFNLKTIWEYDFDNLER